MTSAVLSDIGVTYDGCAPNPESPSCQGWPGLLAGSAYADVPLESVTLAEVLADPVAGPRFDSTDLGDLDLSSSSLDSLPLSSVLLGNLPISSIGLGGTAAGAAALTSWCGQLAQLQQQGLDPYACSDFGIGSATASTDVSLITLALAGVPLRSVPLRSVPLSALALTSGDLSSLGTAADPVSVPLRSVPLRSVDLAVSPLRSVPLSAIDLSSSDPETAPLRSVALAGISPGAINCSDVDCATGDLGEASDAGAIEPGATLGDIPASDFGNPGPTIGDLVDTIDPSDPTYQSLTLEDILATTVPPASYQWQAIDLSSLPLAADETTGGSVAYTASIDVSGGSSTVQASVGLPATFAYLAGSSSLDGAPFSDPAISGQNLTWTTPSLAVGVHTLTFEANAGIGLGPAQASLAATVPGGTASSASASVDVIDGEEPAVASLATAVTLDPGTADTATPTDGNLNIGYITSPGDVNYWSVTVPQNAELSLALTNVAAGASDDLVLFGPGSPSLTSPPAAEIPGVTDTLPDLASSTTAEATPGSQDIPLKAPAGEQLLALSNNPGNQSQFVQTPPLSGGTYVVQVSGYNGSYSSQPYLLQADLLGGNPPPSCPAGIPYLSSLPAPATTPSVPIPSNANTLFLVDTQRLTAAFPNVAGATDDEATVMSNLQALAGDTPDGVIGAVLPVDSYPGVQGAVRGMERGSLLGTSSEPGRRGHLLGGRQHRGESPRHPESRHRGSGRSDPLCPNT